MFDLVKPNTVLTSGNSQSGNAVFDFHPLAIPYSSKITSSRFKMNNLYVFSLLKSQIEISNGLLAVQWVSEIKIHGTGCLVSLSSMNHSCQLSSEFRSISLHQSVLPESLQFVDVIRGSEINWGLYTPPPFLLDSTQSPSGLLGLTGTPLGFY